MKNSSVIYPQWVRKLTQGVAKELLFLLACFAEVRRQALASMELGKINLEKQNVKLNTGSSALHQVFTGKI